MTRSPLPFRRENETIDLFFGNQTFAVTIGFRRDGSPGEVFVYGAKVGSDLHAMLSDACIVVSLLLQHGVQPAALAHSMGRAGNGVIPASLIGALTDLLAETEPHLQTAAFDCTRPSGEFSAWDTGCDGRGIRPRSVCPGAASHSMGVAPVTVEVRS